VAVRQRGREGTFLSGAHRPESDANASNLKPSQVADLLFLGVPTLYFKSFDRY